MHAILNTFPMDSDWWRLDSTAHPFATSFATTDIRITTRYSGSDIAVALFSTLHEIGHGLYDNGVDPALERSPLARPASLGLHESQSRMWENMVGRSRPFWRHFFRPVRMSFPNHFGSVDPETFYRAVNKVQPSFIRTEADEVTYDLHIILRFELEQAIFAGDLELADLPEAWNERFKSLFGLDVPDDARGVLQDVHWADGAFGYFPTYSFGNLIAGQLWQAAREAMPDLDPQIAQGNLGPAAGMAARARPSPRPQADRRPGRRARDRQAGGGRSLRRLPDRQVRRHLRPGLTATNQALQRKGMRRRAQKTAAVSAMHQLLQSLEARDPGTYRHSKRTARFAAALARDLGMRRARVEVICAAGLLHDIGKVGIPDSILHKPGLLSPEEWAVMCGHSEIGAAMVERAGLGEIANWILHLHERFDGLGYPDGLSGESIPRESRLLHAADTLEAMTSQRPYRSRRAGRRGAGRARGGRRQPARPAVRAPAREPGQGRRFAGSRRGDDLRRARGPDDAADRRRFAGRRLAPQPGSTRRIQMATSRFDRWGPIAGIVFAVLFVVGLSLINIPSGDDSAQEITDFYNDSGDRAQLIIGGYLLILAGVFFFWFLASLRTRLIAAEGRALTADADRLRQRPGVHRPADGLGLRLHQRGRGRDVRRRGLRQRGRGPLPAGARLSAAGDRRACSRRSR